MNGVELIAAERARQIAMEGWTPEHDDNHDNAELADAARCYIRQSSCPEKFTRGQSPFIWPWEACWWKPSPDPVRNLVKAGALIAAEIDRLQRLKDIPQTSDAANHEASGYPRY